MMPSFCELKDARVSACKVSSFGTANSRFVFAYNDSASTQKPQRHFVRDAIIFTSFCDVHYRLRIANFFIQGLSSGYPRVLVARSLARAWSTMIRPSAGKRFPVDLQVEMPNWNYSFEGRLLLTSESELVISDWSVVFQNVGHDPKEAVAIRFE
ncbi:hypothetical protein K432DRAFT_223558 [Lepidopterella palustris CBS 459.81]|uniref:Uncharacterized protein n=1 Tax=Lepidopterella palustris CBS 459.81 TaxID=1314670 RepID=A0A8E2JH28_9PEZI|nr:hypothetical protein K432DRAFT_223558 [Lepidopterella palustris CBS 459.81]